jgi:hypothetical protein
MCIGVHLEAANHRHRYCDTRDDGRPAHSERHRVGEIVENQLRTGPRHGSAWWSNSGVCPPYWQKHGSESEIRHWLDLPRRN